jgi:hypothetical protein
MNLRAKWVPGAGAAQIRVGLRRPERSSKRFAAYLNEPSGENMDRFRTLFLTLAAGSLLLPVGWAAAPPDASFTFDEADSRLGNPVLGRCVRENGAAISAVGFDAGQWYPATVPSTVLVRAG